MEAEALPSLAEYYARRRRRLLVIAANVVLLAAIVGGSYVRGHLRSRALFREFGALAACVLGARAAAKPGLGLPLNADAAFAARVLRGDEGWPKACESSLDRLSIGPVIWLFPGLKGVERDLRRAVQIARRELRAAAYRRPAERFSRRPFLAIEQLRAVVAQHARTAGMVDLPMHDAISLPHSATLPVPTRVPLYARLDAQLSLWGSERALSALALDDRGLSSVHVEGGELAQTRVGRPRTLGALRRDARGTWLGWFTPRERCRARALGCAGKVSGVAPLTEAFDQLPEPRWLASHPAGRWDRSVWLRHQRVVLLAERPDGAAAVREFAFDSEPPTKPSEQPEQAAVGVDAPAASGEPETARTPAKAEPLAPKRDWGVRLAGAALLVDAGEERPRLYHAFRREPVVRVEAVDAAGASRVLAEIERAGEPWLAGLSCGERVLLAYGVPGGTVLVSDSPNKTVRAWQAAQVTPAQPVADEDPSRDDVKLLCSPPDTALALVRDAQQGLSLLWCKADRESCELRQVASRVRYFSALSRGEHALVAYAGRGDEAQVRVRRIELSALRLEAERVPAACWTRGAGGLCGPPRLAQLGRRTLLAVREGSDLRALESTDDGLTFRPFRGLKKSELGARAGSAD